MVMVMVMVMVFLIGMMVFYCVVVVSNLFFILFLLMFLWLGVVNFDNVLSVVSVEGLLFWSGKEV